MQKHSRKPLAFLALGLTFMSWSYDTKPKDPSNWVGHYIYEEKPVKAIAGYHMVMVWELSIDKENNGILEVNGQQTYMKLHTDIAGDTRAIAIIYNSLIDGSSENLKKGDTLFTMSGTRRKLITKWYAMKPRLIEKAPKECACFQ